MAFLPQNKLLALSARKALLILAPWRAERSTRLLSTDSGRLTGKMAFITGASRGIGKATAAEFISNGAKVVIADADGEEGEKTAAELGPAASFVHCDVSQESSISSAIDFTVSKHGRLDVAFHNAGIPGSAVAGVVDLDMAEFDRVIGVNLRGVVAGIKHSARVMVPQKSGSIICTASVTGILGGMGPVPYSASKFAVAGVVKCVAADLCRYGIRVNCISPFVIPTRLSLDGMSVIYPGLEEKQRKGIAQGAGVLEGANCEAVDIAKAALYLASDDAKYVSGHNLVVDGGFTSFKSLGFPAPNEVCK